MDDPNNSNSLSPWAVYDDCCKQCGTTRRPHFENGYCEACYQHKYAINETVTPLYSDVDTKPDFDDEELVTIMKASKILSMATESIRRLETTGELVPASQHQDGVRMYRMSDVARYGNEHHRFAAVVSNQQKKTKAEEPSFEPSEYQYDQAKLSALLDDMVMLDTRVSTTGFVKLKATATLLSVDYQKIEDFLRLYSEYLPIHEARGQKYIKRSDIDTFLDKSPDLNDMSPEKWNRSRLKCRKCKSIDNPHYANSICDQCVKSSRYWEMKELYESGFTLAQVGEKYGFTRERARQLINKAVQIETSHKAQYVAYMTKDQVMSEVKNVHKLSKNDRTDPLERELDAILVRSFDLYGPRCYLCHKSFNRRSPNLCVYYADGDETNGEDNNIYPICGDCRARV